MSSRLVTVVISLPILLVYLLIISSVPMPAP